MWLDVYDYSPEWDEFQKNLKTGDKISYKNVKSTIISIDRQSDIPSLTIEMDEPKETMEMPIHILVEYIARQQLKHDRDE